ncbi:MAG: ATP-binding cassette domain-containing protein, partial [Chitinophagaceae bacterium]|nr:ATP-binding cassette domain-containing protein [Chitinophagaceae bacterium]
MLILQGITYAHPNKDLLFSNINLTVNRHDKIALVGNNGAGKSTLLRIVSGSLQPLSGTVISQSRPFYVPQIFGQYNEHAIEQVLQIDNKINALRLILSGDVSDKNLELLDNDWNIEERCKAAFA